jgi:hypothetical protein
MSLIELFRVSVRVVLEAVVPVSEVCGKGQLSERSEERTRGRGRTSMVSIPFCVDLAEMSFRLSKLLASGWVMRVVKEM